MDSGTGKLGVGFLFTALILVFTLAGAGQSQTQAAVNDQLRITHGPVLESVTETGAVVAWSTNVSAGTVLHYGSSPDHLNQIAAMPWGGLTHRVELSGLRPNTEYFFVAESPHGQGTGDTVHAPVLSFQTKK